MTITRVKLTTSVLTMPFSAQTNSSAPQATSNRKLATANSISKALSNFRAIQAGTGRGWPAKLEAPELNGNADDVTIETLTVNTTVIHEAFKRTKWF